MRVFRIYIRASSTFRPRGPVSRNITLIYTASEISTAVVLKLFFNRDPPSNGFCAKISMIPWNTMLTKWFCDPLLETPGSIVPV